MEISGKKKLQKKMKERRIKSSHPDYERLNFLYECLAIATNPQMFFDALDGTMSDFELKASIAIIKELIEEELKGGIFKDFLNERNENNA